MPAGNLLQNLRVLNEIGSAIISGQTVEEMIDTVYYHVNQLMDAYAFAIGVYDAKTGSMRYAGARENNQVFPVFYSPAHSNERFSGWVFEHHRSILINNYEKEYSQYIDEKISPYYGIQPASLMFVPVLEQDELLAIISVRTMRANAYTEESLEILKTLAVFIAKALKKHHPTVSLPASYRLDPLSDRELEVLQLLSRGLPNKAIAGSLFVSDSTIKTHTLSIYRKLEAANRTEAIAKARKMGLIS